MGFADFFTPKVQPPATVSHTPPPPKRENVIDNAPEPVQATSPFKVVGVWNADGTVNTSVQGTVELSGGRRANVGEVIHATHGEYRVLSKNFVLAPQV